MKVEGNSGRRLYVRKPEGPPFIFSVKQEEATTTFAVDNLFFFL